MAFWDYIKGTQSVSDALDLDLLRDAAENTKDFDYRANTPEGQYNFESISVMMPGNGWATSDNYARKADLLLDKCPVSKACIEMRSQAIADIPLAVSGRAFTKAMLTSPNTVDRTMPAALKSWETQLSIGGELYLFYDLRVPGRPQVTNFRQDLILDNVKLGQYEYRPGSLTNAAAKPMFVFKYDGSGNTVAAFDANGNRFEGAIQRIAYYNPISPFIGVGAGDSALRAVQVYLAADDLILRKFRSGGAKNGYFVAKNTRSDADMAAIRAQMQALNPDGGLNVLAGGLDFEAAQLTFNELDLDKLRDKMADAICSAFGVNSTMVNVGEATHANLRGMDKIFYRNWTGPEAKFLIGQLEWGVKKYVDPTASITVDENGIQHIQDDIRDNVVALTPLGILTIDEARALLGMDPLPNGEGKVLTAAKPAAAGDAHTGLGQPDTKPGGDTSFNANSGDRGDQNANG